MSPRQKQLFRMIANRSDGAICSYISGMWHDNKLPLNEVLTDSSSYLSYGQLDVDKLERDLHTLKQLGLIDYSKTKYPGAISGTRPVNGVQVPLDVRQGSWNETWIVGLTAPGLSVYVDMQKPLWKKCIEMQPATAISLIISLVALIVTLYK